jgi:hypothetical protein
LGVVEDDERAERIFDCARVRTVGEDTFVDEVD